MIKEIQVTRYQCGLGHQHVDRKGAEECEIKHARRKEIVRRRDTGETYTSIAKDYGVTSGRIRSVYLRHRRT